MIAFLIFLAYALTFFAIRQAGGDLRPVFVVFLLNMLLLLAIELDVEVTPWFN